MEQTNSVKRNSIRFLCMRKYYGASIRNGELEIRGGKKRKKASCRLSQITGLSPSQYRQEQMVL